MPNTPLTDAINALTTYANEITGKSDTNLSDAVRSLADGYGQGGGSSYTGIEVKTDASGRITDFVLHGFEEIPEYILNYISYSRQKNTGVPVVSFADKPKVCRKAAFYNANVSIDWSGLFELEKVGIDYALRPNYGAGNNQSSQVVNLPKFRGYVDATYSAINAFRMNNNSSPYAPLVYNLPVCEVIPQYCWYCLAGNGVSITLGSIGHAVRESKQAPFGMTANAVGTVTIYTTGDKLDAIKRMVLMNTPGANLQFIWKASEATTYNGVSYSAGDTILTSTP